MTKMLWRDRRGSVRGLGVGLIAAAFLLGACNASGKRGAKENFGEVAEKPRKVVIVEPEGVDLARVLTTHKLSQYNSPYAYPGQEPERLVLYKHRYVELDGEAPAEVILSLVHKYDMEAMQQSAQTEPSSYMTMMHLVYSFKNSIEGENIGTLATDPNYPFIEHATQILPLDLDGDGRQELFLRSNNSYNAQIQLYVHDAETNRLNDMIWSTSQLIGYVPFDHDFDGSMELVAFPLSTTDHYYGYGSQDGEQEPEASMLSRDAQGYWHEQAFRRPYANWSDAFMIDFLKGEHFSPSILNAIRSYHKKQSIAFSEEVHSELDALYSASGTTFERAHMLVATPYEDVEALIRRCQPILQTSSSEYELRVACLAALAEYGESSKARDLILAAYPVYREQAITYPQVSPNFYNVPAFSYVQNSIVRAFVDQKDARHIELLIKLATQDVDRQNYYMHANELYPLFQWGYEDDMETHRFELDLLFAALRDTIKANDGPATRVLMEPLVNNVLNSLVWYYQALERKKLGEEDGLDSETEARARAIEKIVDEELPPELIEPLIMAPDPMLRQAAITYFASTDPPRFAQIFRSRLNAEADEDVLNELFGRLYVLSNDSTISPAMWKSMIVSMHQSGNPQQQYRVYNMISYFTQKASPAQIVSLWDEINDDQLRAQMVWQVQSRDHSENLEAPSWTPVKDRILDLFEQSTDPNVRAGLIYSSSIFSSERGRSLLLQVATQSQDIYLTQAALMGLGRIEEPKGLEVLRTRRDEFKEQPYVIYSVLQAYTEHLPDEVAPLVVDELNSGDPTQPINEQLLWSLNLFHVDPVVSGGKKRTVPKVLIDWLKTDFEAGMKIEATSCRRLSQQVLLFFIINDSRWEEHLEAVEAHPDCLRSSSPHMAREFAVNGAIALSFSSPGQRQERLYTFIRQHHDFPHRPIRVTVAQFEENLKKEAERKAMEEEEKRKKGIATTP